MDWGTVSGIMTLLIMIMFISIWVWAWRGERKQSFDEAANLPLHDEDMQPSSDQLSESNSNE